MQIRGKSWATVSVATMKPKTKQVLLLTALAACVLFTLMSFVHMAADIAAYRAKSWVETWENQAWQSAQAGKYFEPSEEDWEKAKSQAEWAVRLSPWNADHKEQAARVWASRYPMAGYGDEKAQPFRTKANEYFRESIRQRPTWPHTYMTFATNKRYMNELDDEYENLMRQALLYGPWEPEVFLRIVDINLDALALLKPTTRQLVLATAEKGLAWTQDKDGNTMPYSQEIWNRIKVRKKDLMICSWLYMKEPAIRHYCLGEAL